MADNDGGEREWKCASWKQEEDHSKATTELLARCNRTVVPNRAAADAVVDELLSLEKVARLSGDNDSTKRLATEVVAIYRILKEYEAMLDVVQVLMRRRAQSSQVQAAIVREAVEGIQAMEIAGKDNRKKVMDAITRMRTLTEGKLHVELDYGRLSVRLAKMHEEDGDLATSCQILQHIQVETMTSMSRFEKLNVLVHHIKLCLTLKDYTRAAIMSRKIGARAIAADDSKALRAEYFNLMVEYYTHVGSYYHIAMCCWELYNCSGGTDTVALQNTILYLLLAAPQSTKDVTEAAECTAFAPATVKENDRVAWLKKLSALPAVIALPSVVAVIDAFVGVNWVSADEFGKTYASYLSNEKVQQHRDALKLRLVEHNLGIIATHYMRCTLSKVGKLVSLTVAEVEPIIMNLVTLNIIYAKIDRVQGIVVFRAPPKPTAEIEEWAQGIDNVMKLINETCHLIAKERMIPGPSQ
jgi:26S proteasome regulatory subunit N5